MEGVCGGTHGAVTADPRMRQSFLVWKGLWLCVLVVMQGSPTPESEEFEPATPLHRDFVVEDGVSRLSRVGHSGTFP